MHAPNSAAFTHRNHCGEPLAALFQDDDGVADIGKFQLIGWTFTAVLTYLVRLTDLISRNAFPELPDIDSALMVLMGLGHGAYLGKKLVTTDTPTLTGLTVLFAADPKTRPAATIIGSTLGYSDLDTFGNSVAGNEITFDRTPVNVTIKEWTDSKVTFELPDKKPNGDRWDDGQKVEVGVIVDRRDSANTLPLTFTTDLIAQLVGQAIIDSIRPDSGMLPMGITIVGIRFGARKGSSIVTVDGQELLNLNVVKWSDTEIHFTLPTQNGQTVLNSPGTTLTIGVIVAGRANQ
jgi:hypothetical protein